jgi:HAD superfamily phosphoserine phosphatase-like hydrolase
MTSLLSSKAIEFIETVLRLKPRFAAFDCDGTLWSGDAGAGFFRWELKREVVSDEIARWARQRYADYSAGKVDEDTMCGEMVTMHHGLEEGVLRQEAREFFEQKVAARIFPDMRELVRRLTELGCEVWAVSSTNEWVIQAGMKHFDIPANRILAASVEIEGGRITDRLIRVPSGEGKARALREVVGGASDAAFGNSRWDVAMLEISRQAFAVNPNPDLEIVARERGWAIYFPDGVGPA